MGTAENTEADREAKRLKAIESVARIRQRAAELGLDKLTLDEINQEIQAARAERDKRARE